MDPMPFKYKRPFAAFMAILLFFLIVADVSIVSNQRRQILHELKKHWQSELDLIGGFITESLLNREYADVENFLAMSTRESHDIVRIDAVTPNNFMLFQYKREKPSKHTFSQQRQIQYEGKNLLTLKIVRDLDPDEKILRNLQLQLLAGSIVVTLIMGMFIWFAIRRTALRPLEREIPERMNAEELLQRTKDELEITVQERTTELIKTNKDLHYEVTEREKAEEKLREREQYLQTIIETEPECVKVLAFDGTLVTMNPAGLAMIEADSLGQVADNKIYPLIVPEYREVFRELTESVRRGNRGVLEFEIVGFKGTRRWLETHAVPLRDAKNNIVGLLGVTRDITVRKKNEEKLKLSEEKFSKAFRSSPTLNSITTVTEGRFIDVNDAYLTATGYRRDEVVGHSALDLGIWAETDDRNKILNMLREHGIVSNFETRFRTRSGDLLTVLFSAEMVDIQGEQCILAGILDITERRNLELQLFQSQKMEAVGQLAGGVAHDFNNILTAIISNCYLLGKRIGEDDPAFKFVDSIMKLSNNAAKTTRELLVFSRRSFIELAPVDLNDIISSASYFMKNFLREDIELKTIFTEEALVIMADRNQIEQILMNLATNARDAMPDGGIISVESELIEMDSNFIKLHGFGKPGKYALLSFADTGAGMNSETVQKIFEPFFTTKEVGKGTGLGLAIVYGIVKQHKGHINVYSEPGNGTIFRIYFPEIRDAREAAKSPEYSQLLGKGETILLAEDEQRVRESTRQILEEYNYKVIEAVDGKDAVEKYLQYKDKIDILIFDVIMPKMSGQKALEVIRKIDPGIKAIFTSGYAGDIIPGEETGKEYPVFISKPLLPENLLSNIRELLK